jgi:hypothetical protein
MTGPVIFTASGGASVVVSRGVAGMGAERDVQAHIRAMLDKLIQHLHSKPSSVGVHIEGKK